jgi:hypothetical protein
MSIPGMGDIATASSRAVSKLEGDGRIVEQITSLLIYTNVKYVDFPPRIGEYAAKTGGLDRVW